MPLFTVLLPTHFRSDVIEHAINSVLKQDETDFELFIVGDGAELGTADVVAGFSDPRIHWMDFPKAPGFGYSNRNRALAQARGRYIALVSDDDLIFPDHLSRLRKHLEAGAVLACTRAIWISSDGIATPMPTNLGLSDELQHFKSIANILPSTCFAYVRSAVGNGVHFSEDAPHSGDWLLWRRLLNEHPDIALSVEQSFTVMHFTARRHAARYAGLPEMRVLLDIADGADWWPSCLRPNVPSEGSVQAVWANALKEPQQVEVIRDALRLVVDRLAWERVQTVLPPSVHRVKLPHSMLAPKLPVDFDSTLYLQLNPDVAAAGVNPIRHWFEWGRLEGRRYKAS